MTITSIEDTGEEDRGGSESVLFIHHRDISSPIGTTVPYYLTSELSESYEIHAICRKNERERAEEHAGQKVELYDIDTGEVRLVSPILFWLVSLFYASYLGLVNKYTAVYSFQMTIVQGLVSSRLGGSRFVVGLQSVPVRQTQDFIDSTDSDPGARKRLTMGLSAVYAKFVEMSLVRSSRVICLTDGILEVTEEVYGISLPDTEIIGMGVDTEKFADRSGGGECRDLSGRWTAAYIGSITPTRGLEHVLDAISESDYDVELLVAGNGPDEYIDSLTEMSHDLGIADRVEFLGLVPHEDVPDLLSRTDIALSPLPDIESYRISFPAKLLEYMASGSVVIATDILPHRRLIEDGETGYLYDGSGPGLMATFERCLGESNRRDHVRQRARQAVESYDWDEISERYESAIFKT